MNALPYYDPKAGPWVAYRDAPRSRTNPDTKLYELVPGETTRCYLYSVASGTGMQGDPEKCDRFKTKAAALAAARKRWPQKMRGYRIGAERVES